VLLWLRHGWHVALAYVIGFSVMLTVVGWKPHEPHKKGAPAAAAQQVMTPDSAAAK
jgi:hypothetical protein